METFTKLRFFCIENPSIGSSSRIEHITADGQTVLCNAKTKGSAWDPVTWDSIHSPRFHRRCPKCQEAAARLLRPVAVFWYLDPFNGDKKEFPSLNKARKSAKTEHGTCTIWQRGPGETNKIVEFVKGLDPLP